MEKAFIDFLNRLYDLTYDFAAMKKVVAITMGVCIVLSLIYGRQRRRLTHE